MEDKYRDLLGGTLCRFTGILSGPPSDQPPLKGLHRAEWYSALELARRYWQVRVASPDQEKTAFATPLGLCEFSRMPFGLCNTATFQRLLQCCLGYKVHNHLLIYLDDVIIHSPDFMIHLQHLEQVFRTPPKPQP